MFHTYTWGESSIRRQTFVTWDHSYEVDDILNNDTSMYTSETLNNVVLWTTLSITLRRRWAHPSSLQAMINLNTVSTDLLSLKN